MTIDKAIEILETYLADYSDSLSFDFCDSIKLGIEALKREGQRRNLELTGIKILLPGETKE